jgi:alcohol dehydrogenase class IV
LTSLMVYCVAHKVILNKLLKTDPANKAVSKYAKLGKYFSKTANLTRGEYAVQFIERLEQLVADLNLPGLAGYGLQGEMLEDIINNTSQKNNPVRLNNAELMQILRSRL